ncbi:hypothetical protein JHK82_027592 [Glycine max]|nr:hypothetical protein JHK82_027592 [Glycine max]KAG5151368.1 hypothetical protein JHK84_027840 [Glycine max]
MEWKRYFSKLEVEHFQWACPWYHSQDMVFSCGNFPNVSLMRPRGCVAYTPTVAFRQLKWTQGVPNVEELRGLIFQYASGDSHRQQEERNSAQHEISQSTQIPTQEELRSMQNVALSANSNLRRIGHNHLEKEGMESETEANPGTNTSIQRLSWETTSRTPHWHLHSQPGYLTGNHVHSPNTSPVLIIIA